MGKCVKEHRIFLKLQQAHEDNNVAVVIMAGDAILVDDPPSAVLFPKPLIVTEEFGGPGRGGVKMTFTWKTRLHSLSPDPPTTLESFTIPNEGGSARKTEYTFFCKVQRREISI